MGRNFSRDKFGRIIPVYHKTDVLGLQAFLREKFHLWAGTLAHRRLLARICAIFKAYSYTWRQTWKAIGNRILQKKMLPE